MNTTLRCVAGPSCGFDVYVTKYWSSSMLNCLATHSIFEQFYITFSNQWAPLGSVVGSFCACLMARISDDAADAVKACSCHKNASFSCWGCICHQSWYPAHVVPCPCTIYQDKYNSGLCIHYGVDLWFSISFRIQTDGALLTLRTLAQGQ